MYMAGFPKKYFCTDNYKYFLKNIQFIVSWGHIELLVLVCNSQGHSVDILINSYIIELPTILDSLLQASQYHKHLYIGNG